MLVKSAYAGSLSDEPDTIPDGAPVATEPMSTEDGRPPVNSQVSTVGNPAKPVKNTESRSQLLRRRFAMAVKHNPYSVKVQRLTWLLETDVEFLLKSGYYVPSEVKRGPKHLRDFHLARHSVVYTLAYRYLVDRDWGAHFNCDEFKGVRGLIPLDRVGMHVACSLLSALEIDPGRMIESVVFDKTSCQYVPPAITEKQMVNIMRSLLGSTGRYRVLPNDSSSVILSFSDGVLAMIGKALGRCGPSAIECIKAQITLDRAKEDLLSLS